VDRAQLIAGFRAKLDRRELCFGMACSIPSAAVVEIACRTGSDFIILDTEHCAIDTESIEQLVRAADVHRVPTLVKLRRIDEIEIRLALDVGMSGVIGPLVRSPDDVRRLVDACLFPPRGHRGLCALARANQFACGDIRDLVRWTNEQLMVVPIIETAEAVERLEEIIAVEPSIQVYDIGPVDLALSMGLDIDRSITNPSPELVRVLDHVISTLKAHDKRILLPTRFPNIDRRAEDVTSDLRQRGADLIYAMDTHVLAGGCRLAASLKTY
jgi:2-keto-3-deoxy-L-rhamnonate aldolase RhmA